MKNDLLKPDYYHIPRLVADEVKPHEAFVFSVVYWFQKMKDGRCIASNVRIAEALPYKSSLQSVNNALQVLEDKGFIKRLYRDEAKKIRSEIICTTGWVKVGELGLNPQVEPLNPPVEGVKPTGLQNSNNTNKSNGDTSETEVSQSSIARVIRMFERINPAAKLFYRNKTQREACKMLVREFGFDNVELVVTQVLPETNRRPRYEFPYINSPDLLIKNWSKLRDGVNLKKIEKEEKVNKYPIAFLS